MIISMVINAQDSNSSTFYRNKLLGKKWTMSKNDNGQYYAFTLVFENDSVTATITMDSKTTTIRYAYYLSDYFPVSFDETQVGNTISGNWLLLNRYDVINGNTKREGAEMRIFSLTDEEFSFGKSSKYPMILKAKPLN